MDTRSEAFATVRRETRQWCKEHADTVENRLVWLDSNASTSVFTDDHAVPLAPYSDLLSGTPFEGKPLPGRPTKFESVHQYLWDKDAVLVGTFAWNGLGMRTGFVLARASAGDRTYLHWDERRVQSRSELRWLRATRMIPTQAFGNESNDGAEIADAVWFNVSLSYDDWSSFVYQRVSSRVVEVSIDNSLLVPVGPPRRLRLVFSEQGQLEEIVSPDGVDVWRASRTALTERTLLKEHRQVLAAESSRVPPEGLALAALVVDSRDIATLLLPEVATLSEVTRARLVAEGLSRDSWWDPTVGDRAFEIVEPTPVTLSWFRRRVHDAKALDSPAIREALLKQLSQSVKGLRKTAPPGSSVLLLDRAADWEPQVHAQIPTAVRRDLAARGLL
jgi:hypothetical protein